MKIYYLVQLQAGTQPIHFAAGNGHAQMVELLLNKYKVTPGVLNDVSESVEYWNMFLNVGLIL